MWNWKGDVDVSGGQQTVLKTTTPARKPPAARQLKITASHSLSPQITDNKLFTRIMARASAFGIGRAFSAVE
jgi:hypothetical protein